MRHESSALKRAMSIWVKYGVMNRGDTIPTVAPHADHLFFSYGLIYKDGDDVLKSAVSRKQLEMMIEMENI